MPRKKKPRNVHGAASPEDCENMGRRNGWDLKQVRFTTRPVLEVDCIFDGEQTSFEDERLKDD